MKTIILIISLIILLNIGFSYKLFSSTLYGDTFEGLDSEISKIFNPKFEKTAVEYLIIGNLLKEQPDIENSYVMAQMVNYAYYAGSNFLYTDFRSGNSSDSIEDFISRENWSNYDLYISNIHSYPRDKYNSLNPVPDYVVYRNIPYDDNTPWYQKPPTYANVLILQNPDDPNFPSSLELLYHSEKTDTFVYKVHKEKFQ